MPRFSNQRSGYSSRSVEVGNWIAGRCLDGYKKQIATASLHAIDSTDFGMIVSQNPRDYGAGDTLCCAAGPNADIQGDGFVDLRDLSVISRSFLEDNKDCGYQPERR